MVSYSFKPQTDCDDSNDVFRYRYVLGPSGCSVDILEIPDAVTVIATSVEDDREDYSNKLLEKAELQNMLQRVV